MKGPTFKVTIYSFISGHGTDTGGVRDGTRFRCESWVIEIKRNYEIGDEFEKC